MLTVARKDLLLELRSKEVVVATLFFSGLVLVILAFALGPDETGPAKRRRRNPVDRAGLCRGPSPPRRVTRASLKRVRSSSFSSIRSREQRSFWVSS